MGEELLKEIQPLDPRDREKLEIPLCEGELLATLKKMKPQSAPGPDGLTVGFWLHHREYLLPILARVGEAIGKTQRLPNSMRAGLIRLIYKGKGDPADPDKYRPIALLPVHLKVFTKAWAERWKPMLNLRLSPQQSGFLSGRQPGENVRIAQDSWELFKRQKRKGSWMFLYFQKAYDRVSWTWLKRVVEAWQPGKLFLDWLQLSTQRAIPWASGDI